MGIKGLFMAFSKSREIIILILFFLTSSKDTMVKSWRYHVNMLHGYVITCLDAYVHIINILIMMWHKICVHTYHTERDVLLMTTLLVWILILQLV